MLAATVNAFGGGETSWFCTVLCCVLLITFHTLWVTAAKFGRVSEGLTIKTLYDGSRVLKFLPSDYAVAQLAMLEYFTHISSWLESYHEYRVLVYHCSSELVRFGDLRYFHCLNVGCSYFFTDVLFWDVRWDALQYLSGLNCFGQWVCVLS